MVWKTGGHEHPFRKWRWLPTGGPAPSVILPECCPLLARGSRGLCGSRAGWAHENWGAAVWEDSGEPSGESKVTDGLDGVLACRDEPCLQLLGTHCRASSVSHVRPLHNPNFSNDLFFPLKIHELAPTGALPGPFREVLQAAP